MQDSGYFSSEKTLFDSETPSITVGRLKYLTYDLLARYCAGNAGRLMSQDSDSAWVSLQASSRLLDGLAIDETPND
jgi:hypothetical protein